MPTSLPTPIASYADIDISLGGTNFTFTFKTNNREGGRQRIDIYQEDTPIIIGMKVIEGLIITQGYNLTEVLGGEIFCVRMKDIEEVATLSNTFIGGEYELIYYSKQELGGFLGG